jgi:ribonucleoside-triphosphate reductase
MGVYEDFIHKTRYARYLPEEQRRESWEETVGRYVNFWTDRGSIDLQTAEMLKETIESKEVMPSMRCMMTAGEALNRDNVAGFNCSYLPIDHPRAFDELLYILMCGTGVGFSVERQYIAKLPEVSEEFFKTDTVVKVSDSKIGWAKATREFLSLLWAGQVPDLDVSLVRGKGAALKTFGGRASGPEPLVDLFHFSVDLFKGARGRKLTSIECHDLVCKIADIVVVGGVRRSALISLSNLTDDRMRRAKMGQWYEADKSPHRALANNSACYTEKPDFESFLKEWSSMYESRAGERGFFSRVASQKIAARNGRRDHGYDFGTNPCAEIILRPNQFCNLSEIVARQGDTLDDLKRKCEAATILGTLQATLTDFRYLRSVWKTNTEEEALLGVSITGIMDHEVLRGDAGVEGELDRWLQELREVAISVNKKWAKKLKINPSAAITCVKPSGTVSQLVDSASGIHPRYSEYYVRRVRCDEKDPMVKVLKDAGVPWELPMMGTGTVIFSFPMKSPKGATTNSQLGPMKQLEVWDAYQKHWCEHKPSMTCYYTDKDFLKVGQWLYDNFDDVSGISFLPYDDHVYAQAPYTPVSKEDYEELKKSSPESISWDLKEESDVTEGAQQLACVSGVCEI